MKRFEWFIWWLWKQRLGRCIGRTTDTDEYAFNYPDRAEKHRHYDIGNNMGMTAKYDVLMQMLTSQVSQWQMMTTVKLCSLPK